MTYAGTVTIRTQPGTRTTPERRACAGRSNGRRATCSCGWKHRGSDASAALDAHLYGDLSPKIRVKLGLR
jgi:hypothetical protein